MNNEEKILSILETLTTNVNNLTTNFNSLTTNVNSLTTNVNSLTTNVNSLTTNVNDLKSDVTNLKSELAETKRIVVKIENDQGQKLKALADGYFSLYESVEEIREDVAVIKSRLEAHDIHIKHLEMHKNVN